MINNIQALRAFAAINVVLYHIIGISNSYSQPTTFFQYLNNWGASGVDIFFVISGFVMVHTQIIKRKSPFEFFKSRVIRIVPIYWVVTLFFLFLYLIFPSLFREILITPIRAISSLFFTSSVFAGKPPVILVGWTLEWEMLFYLVFALALFLKSWRLLGTFVIVTLTLFAMISKNWIVFEFIFGMLAAYFHHKKIFPNKFGALIFLFGTFLLALSLLPIVRNFYFDRIFIWGISSFFIVLGAVFSNQIKSSLLLHLGDASYSIYLVQMLTIPAFYKFSSKLLTNWNCDIIALSCLVISVVFGCIVYKHIENPITVRLKRIALF